MGFATTLQAGSPGRGVSEATTNGDEIKRIIMEVTAASCSEVSAQLGISSTSQQLDEVDDMIPHPLVSLPPVIYKKINGQPLDTLYATRLADIRS